MCIPALWIFVRELHDQGIAVTVFALHYPYTKEPYSWFGIPVIPLNGRNKWLQRKVGIPIRLKRLFAKEHQVKPFTHIHSFWLGEATYLGIQLAKKHKLPIIASAMGQDVLADNNYLKRIDPKALKGLISLSVFHQDQLLKSMGWQSTVVPFGLQEIEPIAVTKTVDLIGIGSLIPLKNYGYFVELCGRLVQQFPHLRSEIIGVGPEQERLQTQIDASGLANHLKLVGLCSYEETQQRLASAKLLLHPSVYESFGMIFIEGLALQAHVVANKVGFAMDHPTIHSLSGNLEYDAEMIASLLVISTPEREVHGIKTTVEGHLAVYDA
ncbi:MAG: glycosyltransferase [Fluviicola sp.]|nr:glycosyltransferase [Fluviicola sp.]